MLIFVPYLDPMRNEWYKSKWSVISLHILCWVVLFLLPLLLQTNDHGRHIEWRAALFNPVHVCMILASVCFFYLNTYLLIPVLVNRKKKGLYVLMLLFFLAVWILILPVIINYGDKNHGGQSMPFHRQSMWLVFPFIFIWSISTLFRTSADAAKTDQLLKEKENENLKTELSFLRSQVSPHFLFNVLNNMVSMARLKSEALEPSLIKLAGLMRYMLYESDEDKVALSREIEYITSYIDLQRMRYGPDMKISVDLAGLDNEEMMIEPMLLIPFIENAFKHGTGIIDHPEIVIVISTGNGMLDFCIKNKFSGQSEEVRDKTSGIGLPNVRRRLNLLYERRHHLVIETRQGWFEVVLQLKLI